MKRKIVQITERFVSHEDQADIIALADDGTLWSGGLVRVITVPCQRNEKGQIIVSEQARYEFQWEALPGLPDATNLTRVTK